MREEDRYGIRSHCAPALSLVGLLFSVVRYASTPQATKPNFVFILMDNVGWGDFGAYGGTTPTPRIDKLASEGIRFNNYNVESQCTPTRSAIVTGRMSAVRDVYRAPSRRRQLRSGTLGIYRRQTSFRRRLCHGAVREGGTWATYRDACPTIKASTNGGES
jgi:hypothetical protein